MAGKRKKSHLEDIVPIGKDSKGNIIYGEKYPHEGNWMRNMGVLKSELKINSNKKKKKTA